MNYDNAMSVLYGLPWFCQTEVTLQALEPLAKVVMLLIRFLVKTLSSGPAISRCAEFSLIY